MRRLSWLLVLLVVLLVNDQESVAAIYYVATTGTDNAGCGASTAPCATINYTYKNKVSAAGDTILVQPGTYTSNGGTLTYGMVRLYKSGTAESPITIRSITPGGAILDNQSNEDYPTIFYVDGGAGGNYNIIDGFEMTGSSETAIMVWQSTGTQIINNEIHGNGTTFIPNSGDNGAGIFVENTANNTYIANNYFHNHPSHNLYLEGDNTTVINNIIADSTQQWGIQLRGHGAVMTNAKIYHNVFVNNTKGGLVVYQDMNGVEIKNNIFYQNPAHAVDVWDAQGGGLVIDTNISYGNTDGNLAYEGGSTISYTATNWITSNPLFVNTAAADFHLQLGSPAIDAGLTLASVTHDRDAVVRPQGSAYDIGAYEYVVTAPTNNLALNKTTTVSSTESGSFPGSNAVDGSATTRWSSAFSNPQWIYVDLGSSYTVTGVKLVWELAYGSTFTIQTSANASDWTDVYSTSSGTGGTQILDVTPSTGRYVRMYGTVRGTSYGYSLWEFEVYGSPPTASRALSGVRLIGGRMQ